MRHDRTGMGINRGPERMLQTLDVAMEKGWFKIE